jgi:hypothetical protein
MFKGFFWSFLLLRWLNYLRLIYIINFLQIINGAIGIMDNGLVTLNYIHMVVVFIGTFEGHRQHMLIVVVVIIVELVKHFDFVIHLVDIIVV